MKKGLCCLLPNIGSEKIEHIEGSKRTEKGAHRFRIAVNAAAPKDIYLDLNNRND